ncbi:oxidoreductase [Ancylobacter sp. MQZ15Z-1]|uniref:Oxidoreductase n=1 Tax=Ancylobacter mangrovi TaxID=2972472 RepID=A0A9X2PI14_9HYPH|nr:MDR family oxidoreductase [Ancylobacter mangrovi]MCS0494788.1 oxidoreductase [Ancylobacter mangrovi]
MSGNAFQALVLRQADGATTASVETMRDDDLPAGEVTIAVRYSSLNYKDGLAITGKGRIVRNFPMVPGIDLAGVVEESRDARFPAGAEVVLTGWGVGETNWGGMAQKARAKGDWLVARPQAMSLEQTMSFGTAGLTAMLCVDALERHGIDRAREVLVTGASGGVGSVAVALLAKLGYRVAAATGRPEHGAYLRELGAETIVPRAELAQPSRPLASERWGGAVDTVGGQTLVSALAATAYGGAVAACGLVGGADLPGTVMPFIIRGVSLLGIDSVRCPIDRRTTAWRRLSELLPDGLPGEVVEEIGLGEVADKAADIVRGAVRGRVVVKLPEH